MEVAMKRLYLFLLVAILSQQVLQAQDGWFYQNPTLAIETLCDVCFIDENTGWAVGDKIIKTIDGGNNWIVINEEGGDAIFFTDLNNGWVAGYRNLLKTTDGGNHWVKINYANNEYDNLSDVYFIDTNNGYVVGFGWIGGDAGGKILKTTNGGNSWSSQLTETDALWGIQFTDLNNGWAVGYSSLGGSDWAGTILKTTDGGQSWETQLLDSNIGLRDAFFIDSTTGWATGNKILKTTDGGENWVTQFIDTVYNDYWNVCFTDTNNGFVVGNSTNDEFNDQEAIILRTTNGGKDWVKHFTGIIGWGKALRGACFPNANTGMAVGGNVPLGGNTGPIILRTTDGGNNWFSQIKDIHHDLHGISFANENIGTAVGNYGTIVRTTDGGNSWISQTSGTHFHLTDVCFIDANVGTAVGSGWSNEGDRIILRTTDGGNNWITQLKDSILYANTAVFFIDANTGWVVGGNKILNTSDGGENWTTTTINSTYGLNGIYFTDANTGTVVGYEGTILRTTNGGGSWVEQTSGTTYPLNSVFFTSANVGWIVGWKWTTSVDGVLLHTTDGGNNWTTQFTKKGMGFTSLFFTSDETGWIVGGDWGTQLGGILYTTDGGNNWIEQTSGTTKYLNSVYFTSPTSGWIVGVHGTILKTTNGGVTFVEEQIDEIPTAYTLSQNYPNPFNPTTKISWQSPVSSKQVLKVFDVLGNEVAVLVDEEMEAGYHSIDFNASDLPSGVYFYQLKVGNFIETKKMILLR
jgi:photosystem II stability/assembly factor-like uncharacterized protein